MLAGFFDPIGSRGPHLWSGANFDGDHDVDLTDYNALVAHFNPIGYAAAVPEPTGWCLFVAGLLLLHGADVHRPYCSDDRSPRVLPSRRTAAGNFPECRRPQTYRRLVEDAPSTSLAGHPLRKVGVVVDQPPGIACHPAGAGLDPLAALFDG